MELTSQFLREIINKFSEIEISIKCCYNMLPSNVISRIMSYIYLPDSIQRTSNDDAQATRPIVGEEGVCRSLKFPISTVHTGMQIQEIQPFSYLHPHQIPRGVTYILRIKKKKLKWKANSLGINTFFYSQLQCKVIMKRCLFSSKYS